MKNQVIRCTHKRRKRAEAEEATCDRFLIEIGFSEIIVTCPACGGRTSITANGLGHKVQTLIHDKHPIIIKKEV